MVLRDGSAWNTKFYHCAGCQHGEGFLMTRGNRYKPNQQALSMCGTLAILPNGEVYSCRNYRILIRIAQRIPWSASAYCSELSRGLRADKRFCDCEVVCADTVVPCHRAILAQVSPVFDRMLNSGMLEAQRQRIVICEAEPEAVQALLTFVYIGEVDYGSHAPELMRLADFYQLDALVGLCAEQALEALSRDSVSAVARAFRGLRGRPEVDSMWARLMEKVHQDPELFSAVMLQL
mmetsp:Transcript_126821/g.406057  ORF Transcript_126821/g.406057 Transcript_126821/m.406057 type:complete len:235 (-) Transcript_126821:147-851(-)